ncbi:MAG: type II toxin-antitoxin system RelE/ParE family toxin [Azonexus sp.]|nr:type II toxin-antitoxin system RelE/ParE family toxin [Azonexus sp.]MDP3636760.1 type II toxin-antitoxin system RelE/ParE family toxin [Azonexus sp.]MDZ4316401.1 type II toxin-antitoxin system RelE/ParE family toxin [Azonexus sp.]
MPISQQNPEKRLKWSKRSIVDREKIGVFYKEEASLLVALEADKSILAAAKKLKIDSLAYRVGHKAETREHVMRRFPYILVYRVKGSIVEILRVLHQAMRYFN